MFKYPGPGPGSSCQYIAIYTIYNAIYTRVVSCQYVPKNHYFFHLLNFLRLPFPSSSINTTFPSLNPIQIQNSIYKLQSNPPSIFWHHCQARTRRPEKRGGQFSKAHPLTSALINILSKTFKLCQIQLIYQE